ncbi:hypothetical protein JCM10908_003481 [Rhodotorula pacifica]|uniref:uncharacterized protein n=1 Tax=Rhodotorula pacifica TaxID=1495444 RepID=UPI0031815A09
MHTSMRRRGRPGDAAWMLLLAGLSRSCAAAHGLAHGDTPPSSFNTGTPLIQVDNAGTQLAVLALRWETSTSTVWVNETR